MEKTPTQELQHERCIEVARGILLIHGDHAVIRPVSPAEDGWVQFAETDTPNIALGDN